MENLFRSENFRRKKKNLTDWHERVILGRCSPRIPKSMRKKKEKSTIPVGLGGKEDWKGRYHTSREKEESFLMEKKWGLRKVLMFCSGARGGREKASGRWSSQEVVWGRGSGMVRCPTVRRRPLPWLHRERKVESLKGTLVLLLFLDSGKKKKGKKKKKLLDIYHQASIRSQGRPRVCTFWLL